MATEAHSITIKAGSGPVDLYQSCSLDPPVLRAPYNNQVFKTLTVLRSGPIILKWNEVTAADYYVLQWCPDTSFRGPLLRSEKVLVSAYALNLGNQIFGGVKWKWRVFAYNYQGCASPASETGGFELTFPSDFEARWQGEFKVKPETAPLALPGPNVPATNSVTANKVAGSCFGKTKITRLNTDHFMVKGDTKQCTVDWMTPTPGSSSVWWNIDDSDVGLGSISIKRATDRFIEFKATRAATKGSFFIEFFVEDPTNVEVKPTPPRFPGGGEGVDEDSSSSSSSSPGGSLPVCMKRIEVEVLDDLDESSTSSSSQSSLSSSSQSLSSLSSLSSSSLSSLSSSSISVSESSSSSSSSSLSSSSNSSSSSSSSGDDRCVCIAVVTGMDPVTCCYTIEPQTLCMGEGYSFLINDSSDPRWACPAPCS